MTRSLLIAPAALAAAVLAAAAFVAPATASASSAYDDGEVRTDVINVADLDLTTGWGMDRLIKRLRGRIDAMCDYDESCRDEAWLSADWQVARAVRRDQWQKRIAYEREQDRRMYRLRRRAGPPPMVREGPPPEVPRIAYASPPPGAVPVAKTVTTTTQTYTVKTTTVTLTYRLPPPDYRATWTPR